MKLPSCVSCGRPVLQLSGQFANLDSYYLGEGGPPRETAGAWHASCLAASPAATAWYGMRLRNHCDVRDFRPVAELDHWTVVGHPRSGDVVAFGRAGELVSLALGRDRGRSVAGGAVYPTVVPLYNVELDDEPVIADIQRGLDADGSYPVMALIDKLGIADRVVHPVALDGSVFRLDPELREYWSRRSAVASVEHGVFVPSELLPHVVDARR
jgi:hypothetical protein